MAMRVPSTDYEMGRPDPGVTEKEFDRRQSLSEGINGCDRFDSRFENTERTQVLAPRGDARGRPMPRDARFRQADNHGEWGNDQYIERLEFGADGPDCERSYHGAGLPRRLDLSSPANRNHDDAMDALTYGRDSSSINTPPVSHEWGYNPQADGIDGDN
jgi:hypothetical protein